MMKTAHWTWSQ